MTYRVSLLGPFARASLFLLVASSAWLAACEGTSDDARAGTGGAGGAASGGAPSGGAPGDGGAASSGGSGTGGTPDTGGAPSTGGLDGGGGSTGGGDSSTGGASTNDPPMLLSETGLYQADMTALGEGVRPFQPTHALWTDSAAKKRWVRLPAGETIDTSDMDFWAYPTGTTRWKEFARDGVRVETRLLKKRTDGGWQMMAYQWREDQMEADAVPDGVQNASGTAHDIPTSEQCKECHNRMPDKALGFSAIQLSHDAAGLGEGEVTLSGLISEGVLSAAPAGPFTLPGDAVEEAALGYLHANCGHCHNPKSSVSGRVTMDLWLTVAALGTVSETTIYNSTVAQGITSPDNFPAGAPLRIDPQSPSTSAMYVRMDSRGFDYSMPPLGTEEVDAAGLDAVAAWIDALPLK